MVELYEKISFKSSELVTKSYSTSFSWAVGLLPPSMRKAIYGIYGFVRIADEIVDTFLDTNQEELLDNFEKELDNALISGVSVNPIIHAYVWVVKQYEIPHDLTKAFLKSMRIDLHKKSYQDTTETDEYIYGSAEVVGLMCLKVFVNGNHDQYDQLIEPARKLGAAFQKVNFLRDLKNDYELLNRNYFPDFDKNSFDEAFKQKLVKDIEQDFENAKNGIRKLPGKSKLAVNLAYIYYTVLLNRLKRTPAKKIISTRVRVNNFEKVMLLLKGYMAYRFNII